MTAAKKSAKPTIKPAPTSRPQSPPKHKPKAPQPTAAATSAALPQPAKKARAEYEALLQAIEEAKRDEAHGWDREWESIAVILQKSYYLFDDETPTAGAWLKKHTHESYRTGLRNARVAMYASPAEIEQYGATKIDLALSIELAFWQKKHGDLPDAKSEQAVLRGVKFADLRYSIRAGTKQTKVTLAAVTAEQLRAILGEHSKRSNVVSDRMSESAQHLVQSLKKDKTLGNVKVSERDNQLTLTGVRIDQMAALGKLLVQLAR